MKVERKDHCTRKTRLTSKRIHPKRNFKKKKKMKSESRSQNSCNQGIRPRLLKQRGLIQFRRTVGSEKNKDRTESFRCRMDQSRRTTECLSFQVCKCPLVQSRRRDPTSIQRLGSRRVFDETPLILSQTNRSQ